MVSSPDSKWMWIESGEKEIIGAFDYYYDL